MKSRKTSQKASPPSRIASASEYEVKTLKPSSFDEAMLLSFAPRATGVAPTSSWELFDHTLLDRLQPVISRYHD